MYFFLKCGLCIRLFIFWCWLHHLRAPRALTRYLVWLSLCFPIHQLRIVIFSISKVGWKRKQNNIVKIFTPWKVPNLWKVWVLVSSLTCTRNESAFYRNKSHEVPWKVNHQPWGAIRENIFWDMPCLGDSLQRSDDLKVMVLQDRFNPLMDLRESNPWLDGPSLLV